MLTVVVHVKRAVMVKHAPHVDNATVVSVEKIKSAEVKNVSSDVKDRDHLSLVLSFKLYGWNSEWRRNWH